MLPDRGHPLDESEETAEKPEKHRNGKENHPKRRNRKGGMPTLHQQPCGRHWPVQPCRKGHWAVESIHWHLDVTFQEGANTTLDKTAAQNQNIIRK